MKPIHPDDPDWIDALFCASKPGQPRRLRSKRRPLERLIDVIDIVHWRWFAGGRVDGKRHRNLKVVETHNLVNLGSSDDGVLLYRELMQPQMKNLKGYVRPRCKCGAWV